MKKLKTKFFCICACATVLYIVAFFIFNLTYSYDKYWNDESKILVPVTMVYLLAVFAAMFFMIRHKKRPQAEKQPDVIADISVEDAKETETAERPQTPTEEIVEECETNENRQFDGTGIIGLTRYHSFCAIAAWLCLVVAIYCLAICAIGGMAFALISIYFIVGCVCCIVSMPFIKAIITIVKAAKLYIDNNQNNKEL